MVRRRGSDSDKGQTLDSGYRSDHETTYKPKSVRPVLLCSRPLPGVKDADCVSECINSGKSAHHAASSELGDDEAPFGNSSPPHESIKEQSGAQEQTEPEICETDSEDEISLKFNMPYTASKSFPIVPMPSTLVRAGYGTAAMKLEVFNAKLKENAKAQQEVDRSSALPHNSRSERRAAKKRASAGVLVPKQRTRYSFADALEATEGLRQFSDGDGDEREDEYV